MTAREKLDIYLDGWRLGDGDKSYSATKPDFFYDDPATGRVSRSEFVSFVEAFKDMGKSEAGGTLPSPFLTYTDIVVVEGEEPKAWCWWRVTNTDLQGAALIHFDDAGIISERIAYFTTNPTTTPIPA